MAQKNFQFSIREYRPSDHHEVTSLFRDGVLEHVYPAFFKSMSNPDHVGIALSISMAGYVLGGSSYFQALLFGSAWAGLIYYCCLDVYEGYLRRRLSADMVDIQANYLEKPDNGFWVAEVEENGQSKVVAVAAVTGKRREEVEEVEEEEEEEEGEEGAERFESWNGGGAMGGGSAQQDGSYGEMSHLVVLFPWRRQKLGSRLTQTAADFCKERGYGRLVLDVSSPQTAALGLYHKFGFVQTGSHSNTHANRWFSKLARIRVMRMEKFI